LRIEVEVKAWRASARSVAARMEGKAYVDDKLVAEAIVTCQLVGRGFGKTPLHEEASAPEK
jgi:3-hydroxymyristoyl/3-hydroxydecanoyl-(acyl carrier protein) dehydratase